MIKKVELQNWKSHHETDLEFSEGVNALIGTMGSGKSSVLEAIVFALYGTTPSLNAREVKLDDVIRRTPSRADTARVKVVLEVEGEEYSVEREIERGKGTSRSELRKDGELIEAPSTEEVTEQVVKRIGMDFQSFTRAVFSEQNNLDLFLEMRAGKRKERIDELLRLDRFEDARQSAVKVENQMEKEFESKQEDLKALEEDWEEEELEELEEEIEEHKEKIEELEQGLKELSEQVEDRREKLDELKQRRDRHRELEKRHTKLETRLESVEEQVEEIDAEMVEDAAEELEKAREELEELEQLERDIDRQKQELDHLEQKRESLEEEKEQVKENVEKFERFDELEEELDEVEQQIDEIKNEGNQFYAERTNLEESLETLKDTDGKCPTCGRELDEEHREEIRQERKRKIKELKKQEERLRHDIEKLMDRKEELVEERDELLQHRNAAEKLADKKEELESLEKDIEAAEKELEEIEEEFSPERVERVEQEIEELEAAEELREMEQKRDALEEKMDETEEELEELDFDEERMEEVQEEVSDLEKEQSVKQNTVESERELLEEKQKRLENLEKQRERLEELGHETEKLDRLMDYLHHYRTALEDTQVSLRQRFVQRLNDLMDRIWSQVYPYDDYYSIRLNAEEDYLLELLDAENNWISAEAQVSGGERHSAALVMRLGLTFVLSPKIQVLMLDEPTHNLDSSAVEELAETLRDRTSDLIKQLFVVTHDPALEAAATGRLYQFEKKDTETGLTEVEEVR